MKQLLSLCLRGLTLAGSWLAALYRFFLLSQVFSQQQRSLVGTFLLTAAVAALGLILERDMLDRSKPLFNDQQGMFSLEMAVNRVRCGTVSHLRPGEASIANYVPNNAAALTQPICGLPERLAGSIEEYQEQLQPFLNNENSLMLMDTAILRLLPDITVVGLIRAHIFLKAACLAVFVFFLLRNGGSPVFGLMVFYLGLLVIEKTNELHPISLYSFLMPAVVLLIGLFGLALSSGVHRRTILHLAVLAAIGVYGGFLLHLRTSYFPVLVGLLLVYLGFAARDLRATGVTRRRTAAVLGLPLLGFAGGFLFFSAVWIEPIRTATEGTEKNSAYHVIGHPLVLSLGDPESDLSRREGIRYVDMLGWDLARRIDPTVSYLGPTYDKAMLVYYFKLWIYYPAEMVAIYRNKLRVAASEAIPYVKYYMPKNTRKGRMVHQLAVPLQRLHSGTAYLALFVFLACIGFLSGRFLNLGTAFALTALATAGSLLMLESALLVPQFLMYYHNYLLFWILLCGLLFYQLCLNLGSRLVAWLVSWIWYRAAALVPQRSQ